MKRAYLEAALRFRADRDRDAAPAARERAEFRMQELDAAWSVLRNPAARARYDDELRVQAGGEDPWARRPDGGSWADGATTLRRRHLELEAEAATLEPVEDTDAVAAPGHRLSRWAPLLVGAAALVVVLGWAGSAAGHKDPPALKISTVERFGAGTCADPQPAATGPTLVPVACEGAHGYVVASWSSTAQCRDFHQVAFPVEGDRPYVCATPVAR